MKIGRVTLSDRASGGIYEDRSGPEIERVLREQFAEPVEFERVLLPDEQRQIERALRNLCANGWTALKRCYRTKRKAVSTLCSADRLRNTHSSMA